MEGPKNIFWGLVVKPGKRYDTVVQEAFRITKACIEPSSAGAKLSSVFVECDNSEEFIIANLGPKAYNETLDLAFNEGEKICFKVDGPGTIHLTGNILEDSAPGNDSMFDMIDGGSESSEEESEEESDVSAGDKITEIDEEESLKKGKKRKKEPKKEEAKKAKVDASMDTTTGDLDSTDNFAEEEDSDDEDDSDDDDGDTSMDPDTTNMESDDDDDEDDDDDDDDDDEDDEEEEVKPEPEPKKEKKKSLNGSVKVEKTPSKEQKTPAKEVATLKDKEKTLKTPDAKQIETEETPKSKKKLKAEKTPKSEESIVKTPKEKNTKKEAKTPNDIKDVKAEPKTPNQENKKEPKTPNQEAKAENTPGKTPKRTLKGGITVEELKEGNGQECKAGNMVGMYYAGRLKKGGKQFDATLTGKPFKFKLGAGQVIKGWDVGVLGMKVGGKRRLTIPAPMGYGSAGAPPDIPPNADLTFDIECKFVK